jgi:hypothetical protein
MPAWTNHRIPRSSRGNCSLVTTNSANELSKFFPATRGACACLELPRLLWLHAESPRDLTDGEALLLTILLEEVWERRHPAERSPYRRLSPLRASVLRCRRGAGLGGRGVAERRVRVPLRARLARPHPPLPAGVDLAKRVTHRSNR